MTDKTFQFDFNDLKLSVSQIESVMGYREGESEETITDLISVVLEEAAMICSIKAEYRVFKDIEFNDAEKTVKVNDLIFNIKKIVYGQIKRSGSLAFFLCTAGDEIGGRSRTAMKEGDLLKGYIYDVVGSEIVEAAADIMQDSLGEAMTPDGRKITNRFSPGYCGWDVAEQHKLFILMKDNFCGIRLNSSALMDPVKSVSGLIGIGENVKRLPYTCNFCDLKDCIYRGKKA
jgi:hypothetical protein